MEMNTRIQVEHTVTEEVINFDLIKEQIKIAAGAPHFGQKLLSGGARHRVPHQRRRSIQRFPSQPGQHHPLHTSKGHGVRVDTHIYAGYTIPPYYDSMIAKIIVKANTRDEAIAKMHRALEEFVIEGIKTTIPFHIKLMEDEQFRAGNFNTSFLEGFKF